MCVESPVNHCLLDNFKFGNFFEKLIFDPCGHVDYNIYVETLLFHVDSEIKKDFDHPLFKNLALSKKGMKRETWRKLSGYAHLFQSIKPSSFFTRKTDGKYGFSLDFLALNQLVVAIEKTRF